MTASASLKLPVPTGVSDRLKRKLSRNLKERVIESILFAAAAFSVFVTIAIVWVLVKESWAFFEHVPVTDFLFDTQWTPLFDDAHYGIMVLLSGTLTSSGVALVVAIPLGTIIAIYLSEFAGFKLREIAKPFLELLGGVPTIVYGYFALTFLTPILQKIYPDLPGFNLLSAGLVMGVMIIPYVASLSDTQGLVGIDFGVYGVPETFVIDKSGTIRLKHIGPVTPEVLRDTILPLVKKLNA